MSDFLITSWLLQAKPSYSRMPPSSPPPKGFRGLVGWVLRKRFNYLYGVSTQAEMFVQYTAESIPQGLYPYLAHLPKDEQKNFILYAFNLDFLYQELELSKHLRPVPNWSELTENIYNLNLVKQKWWLRILFTNYELALTDELNRACLRNFLYAYFNGPEFKDKLAQFHFSRFIESGQVLSKD